MAKPNYAFARRQREIADKQKKAEKQQRKTEAKQPSAQEGLPRPPMDGPPAV